MLGGGVWGGKKWCVARCSHHGGGDRSPASRQWERRRSALTAPRKRYLRWPLETSNSDERGRARHSAFDVRTRTKHSRINYKHTAYLVFLEGGSWRRSTTRHTSDAMKTNRRAPRCCSTFQELGQAAILPRNKGSWNTANASLFDTDGGRCLIPCH